MSKIEEIKIESEGPVNRQGKIPISFQPGLLGRFFGGVENAPTSISGTVVVLLILSGVSFTFYNTQVNPTEFWKTIVLPTITALFGYLFGKSRK